MARGVKAGAADLIPTVLASGGTLRRDPNNPKYGWVTCPDCPAPVGGEPREERYTSVPSYGSKKFAEYTGRCLPCENRSKSKKVHMRIKQYPTQDQPLGSYGSLAYWSKLDGKWVPVRCGVCQKTHRVSRFTAVIPSCTGLHRKCFLNVSPLNVAYSHEPRLPKGTKVLFHTRADGDRHKVGIECRECFKESRQVKYVKDTQIGSYVRGVLGVYALLLWVETGDALAWNRLCLYLKRILYWDELCSDCVRARGYHLTKFTTAMTAPSGTVTDFSVVKDGKVRVAYLASAVGCGCERWVDRDTASSWWKRFPAVCRYHHNHPEAYAELLQARQTGGNKQGEGKPSGRKRQDRSQWLLAAINAVAELWHRYESLPRQKRIDCITQEDLAPLLGFGGGDPATIAKQVYNRLKDCGLREMFPGVRSWFNSFVETVADGIERGTDSQTILEGLMQRRDRTAA